MCCFDFLHHFLICRKRVTNPLTSRTAAKMRSSSHPPPRPWRARKPCAPKSCARARTAPSLSRRSNSAMSRNGWTPHKVGPVFTERFPGSKSWLGNAFFFIGVQWWAVYSLSVVVSDGSSLGEVMDAGRLPRGSQSFQKNYFIIIISHGCSWHSFFAFRSYNLEF